MTQNGWVSNSLKELCLGITDGSHFSPRVAIDGERIIGTVRDMSEYGFDVSNCKRISEEDYRTLVKNGCKPERGDVLFSKDGTIGIAQYFKGDIDIVLLSSIAILRPNPKHIEGRFLAYALKNPQTNKYIKDNFKSGSALPRIVLKDLKKLKLTVPVCLNEQSQISSILFSLDNKIELNLRMNKTLEAIAKSIFKEWFVDLRFPGYNGVLYDDLPPGWRLSFLGAEVVVSGGSTPSTSEEKYWDGEHHWATPKDLSSLSSPVLLTTERKITEEGVKQISSRILPKGTLLLSSRAPIGYMAITEIPTAINQGFIAIQGKAISNLFVMLWLKRNMRLVEGNANGSTFQEISKANFKRIKIIVPDSGLLLQFDKLITPIFDRITLNEIQNHTLRQARDTLLPLLMSGKISVA